MLKSTTKLLSFLFLLSSAKSVLADNETLTTGSFIVNMGVVPQTIGNGLKPYGMIYDLIKNYQVPVRWVIGQSKAKDGIDFSYNGTDYKGGTFIIPAEYRSSTVNTRITYWQGQGVVGTTTISSLTVNVTDTLAAVPNWTLDAANGSIAVNFFSAAGIPSSAYGFKSPAQLGSCDDIYVMPHADPTWSTHSNLYFWNQNYKGAIWGGCHAVSVLENMYNPSNPSQQTDFLSSPGLVPFGSHAAGTAPYNNQYPSDPVFQYMGTDDAAHQNGSEQVYLPTISSSWRPTTKIGVWDASQSNVPGTSPGPAAVDLYGHAFGNDNYGYVCYESGHNIYGTASANVAAMRIFFNFSLVAMRFKAPYAIVTGVPSVMFISNPYTLGAVVTNGYPPYSYNWTCSVAGTFSPSSHVANPTFTPSASGSAVITCNVTDNCGRTVFSSSTVSIQAGNLPPVANNDITSLSAGCVAGGVSTTISVLSNDSDPNNDPMTVTSVTGNNGTWSTNGTTVTFNGTENFSGQATATYTVCDNHGLCTTAAITVNVGTQDSHNCWSNQVWSSFSVGNIDTATVQTGVSNPANLYGDADGVFATYSANNTGTYLLRLSDTLTAGDTLKITWKSNGAAASKMNLAESLDGSTFSGNTLLTASNTTLITTTYIITLANCYYIRLANNTNKPTIDALTFSRYTCQSRAPQPGGDSYTILEDNPTTMDVVANDNDPAGESITLSKIYTQPIHGMASVNTNNTITYINTTDYSGTDSFYYQVTNVSGYHAEAKVKVTITDDQCSAGSYKATSASTTTVSLSASADASLQGDHKTTTTGTATFMDLIKNNGNVHRDLIQFSLASIPAGVFIQSASLKLFQAGGTNGSDAVGVYALTQSWVESQVSWNNRSTGPTVAWTTAGSTFNSSPYATTTVTNNNNTFFTWDITTLVNSWYNGTLSNNGLLLRKVTESSNKNHTFDTKENATSADRPSLSVTYETPAICAAIPNRAPLANPDSATTPSTTAIDIAVLSNDGDVDGNTLSLAAVIGTVTGGTASVSGNNIHFVPTSGFNGIATLKYSVKDNGSPNMLDTAQVYVKVTNAAPVANVDHGTTNSNTQLTLGVTGNDSDPEGAALASPSLSVAPHYGSASFSGNNLIYTPQANYTGKDTLTYTISEAASSGCGNAILSDTALVIISVTNQAPIAVADNMSTNQCTDVSINVIANDSDPESGVLTVSIQTAPNPAQGSVSISNNQIVFSPVAGYSGVSSFTYKITDNGVNPLTATASVNVTVLGVPVNTKPVAVDDVDTTVQDQPDYVDVMNNDYDPDNNQLVLSLSGGLLQPHHGTITIFNGTLVKYVPAVYYAGTDSFEYIITDVQPSPGAGCLTAAAKSDTARVRIDVKPNPAYVSSISGTVFNDVNGLNNNRVDGTGIGTAGATQLYVSLVDANQVVIASVAVASNGTYLFSSIGAGTYSVQLSTSAGVFESAPPAITLPAGWANTGEHIDTTAGNDGAVDGSLSVTINADPNNVINADLGIEQLPAATDITASGQTNPGGTFSAPVAASTFGGTDPSGGTIASIRITAFPSNATSITINGITYTSGTFPGGGVSVPTNAAGQPTQGISTDPSFNGAGTVVIPYKTTDNAGKESSAGANASVPFTDLTISGVVYDDANGNTDHLINGTGSGIFSGHPLYAYLENISGVIIDSVAVHADGTYSFGNAKGVTQDGNYKISISTVQVAPGVAGPNALPNTMVNTGDSYGNNNVSGSGNETSVDGSVGVSLNGKTSVTLVNFGIDQLAQANNKTYSGLDGYGVSSNSGDAAYPIKISLSYTSQDGNVSFSNGTYPGVLSAGDAEDGNYGGASGSTVNKTIGFSSLPDSSTSVLVYNGNILEPGCTGCTYWNALTGTYEIPNFDPSLLQLYGRNGTSSLAFNYYYYDAAGLAGLSGSYALNFSNVLPVELTSFNGETVNNSYNHLQWVTLSELNSNHFELERSADGQHFQSIGQVAALGTTSSKHAYAFDDQHPLDDANYYRLKQVDNDGRFRYSQVVMLTLHEVSALQASVAPTVTDGEFHITIQSSTEGVSLLQIQDVTGHLVYTQTIAVPQGVSVWPVDVLRGQSAGIYFVRIGSGDNTQLNYKVVKVN